VAHPRRPFNCKLFPILKLSNSDRFKTHLASVEAFAISGNVQESGCVRKQESSNYVGCATDHPTLRMPESRVTHLSPRPDWVGFSVAIRLYAMRKGNAANV
jgi:hypothetical protein